MATIQEILDKINASKSNNINNNSFIDLMRQISGNPEDAVAPVNDTNSIYGHIVQMYTTLYDSGVDYAVLADDIEAIQGLYERLNTIDSLYADKTKLDSLYADKIKLDQLFADKAVIDRVYGSIINIDRVYTSIDKLDTVYASILKMDTVADNIADVNTVADNMIVLNEIYDNRVEIYAADENAAIATTKAIEASNSATIATTKASEASASALAASTASNTSTSKATESAASAVLANTSAGSANTSAASASSNATIATTKASEASVSASNASTNAANASTSASAAAVSASTSATKAIEAATSASTALGYKNDVSTMKLAIETIYDTFDDRFLGTKTTNPLVDNDGNALIDGALYFDTTTNAMKVYDLGTTTWYVMPQIYLNSLLDVQLTSISTGNMLRWNGTKWINYALSKSDVGLNLVDNTADSAKNVLSATKLTTGITIGGVSFDGTANINLPGVNATGNQSITGDLIGSRYIGGGLENPNNAIFGPGKLRYQMLSSANLGTGIGSWNDVIWVSSYTGPDVKGSNALIMSKDNDYIGVSRSNFDATAWSTPKRLAYADGVGAFGTWGISTTGNSATATTLSTNRTNYEGTTDSVVVGGMMWKKYGNNHMIFDASASISPTGVAVNNTNPDVPWDATYPTLMGHNGSTTFGVRVDSSRYADRLSGDRIITLGGDLTGSVNFDGSSDVTLSAEVNDNSHNHTSLSGTVSFSGSSGNTFNSSNIMVNGNGSTNTIKPGIGFHQPSLYAGTLSMLDGNTFQFKNHVDQVATLANNITGNAATATTAADSSKLIGKNWHWSGQGGQPEWLWGGSDGANMYVYNPANFSVNYATSAGSVSAGAVASATAGLEVGSVGSYAFLRTTGQLPLSRGSTTAGSGLYYSNGYGGTAASPSGTWRLMGAGPSNSEVASWASLWLRIA